MMEIAGCVIDEGIRMTQEERGMWRQERDMPQTGLRRMQIPWVQARKARNVARFPSPAGQIPGLVSRNPEREAGIRSQGATPSKV